jgi:hypothetical protein
MERKQRLTLVGLIVIILIAGVLAAVLIPARFRVQESTKRVSCKSDLRCLGIALHLYADDYGNAFPTVEPVPPGMDTDPTHTVQALGLLCPKYVDNVHIFGCPSAPSTCNDFLPGGKLRTTSTGYAYDYRHTTNHAGPVIIAGDCQDGLQQVSANHGGAGGNYMAIDSSVVWVRAVAGQTALVVDPTVDPGGIWTRTNGYLHDSCLRRTDK